MFILQRMRSKDPTRVCFGQRVPRLKGPDRGDRRRRRLVITRCATDSSVRIAPMVHEFGWRTDDRGQMGAAIAMATPCVQPPRVTSVQPWNRTYRQELPGGDTVTNAASAGIPSKRIRPLPGADCRGPGTRRLWRGRRAGAGQAHDSLVN
jgi:hypothetical protein